MTVARVLSHRQEVARLYKASLKLARCVARGAWGGYTARKGEKEKRRD
jgi:hypothetical protein